MVRPTLPGPTDSPRPAFPLVEEGRSPVTRPGHQAVIPSRGLEARRRRSLHLDHRTGDYFLAAAFLVVFLAVFLAGARLAVFFAAFLAGPFSRRSASSSAARSRVMASTVSSLRRVALYSPSVTYSPKRPALTTTGWPETGSLPSSLSGAGGAARPRCLGWA